MNSALRSSGCERSSAMDKISPAARSKNMSAIRSDGNRSTELALLALLRQHGVSGWRRRQPVEGRPDFVWRANRIALFVDGCFWHGCPKCYQQPSSRRSYWKSKVLTNRKRDRTNRRKLSRSGWKVVRVWEHELEKTRWREKAVARVQEAMNL